jgi:hypothetical protein
MKGSDLRGFDVILLEFQWKNSFWILRNPCVFRHFILVQLDLSIPGSPVLVLPSREQISVFQCRITDAACAVFSVVAFSR